MMQKVSLERQSDLPSHRMDFWRKTGFARDPAIARPIRLLFAAAFVVGASCSAFVFGQAKDPLDSSKVLKLTTFATHSPASSPETAIDLTHPRDGSGRIFVSTNEGRVHAFSSSGKSLETFLDFNTAQVADFEAALDFTTNGLSYMAFHPDYARTGAPGEGKLYTFYKSRMPGTRGPDYSGAALATRPGNILSQYALVEWTVDSERSQPNRHRIPTRGDKDRIQWSG